MSLIETLVVLALFTIVSGAIANYVSTFYRQNGYTISQSYQVSNARRGVELMVRDLREMTYSDDGSFPLITKTENAISFYSDIDRDDSVELVEFRLASTTMYKYVYDSSGFPPVYSTTTPDQTYIISEYVQNLLQAQPSFTYYDMDGNEASPDLSVTDIRYIEVSLIINIDPLRNPGEFMLRSSASLRNLKSDI